MPGHNFALRDEERVDFAAATRRHTCGQVLRCHCHRCLQHIRVFDEAAADEKPRHHNKYYSDAPAHDPPRRPAEDFTHLLTAERKVRSIPEHFRILRSLSGFHVNILYFHEPFFYISQAPRLRLQK